jgi:hypothetical protein
MIGGYGKNRNLNQAHFYLIDPAGNLPSAHRDSQRYFRARQPRRLVHCAF